MQRFRENRWKIPHFYPNSCWEMLLKAIGMSLGTAKRVYETPWEMSKSYWIAFAMLK